MQNCKKAILSMTILFLFILAIGMSWSEWYGYEKAILEHNIETNLKTKQNPLNQKAV